MSKDDDRGIFNRNGRETRLNMKYEYSLKCLRARGMKAYSKRREQEEE